MFFWGGTWKGLSALSPGTKHDEGWRAAETRRRATTWGEWAHVFCVVLLFGAGGTSRPAIHLPACASGVSAEVVSFSIRSLTTVCARGILPTPMYAWSQAHTTSCNPGAYRSLHVVILNLERLIVVSFFVHGGVFFLISFLAGGQAGGVPSRVHGRPLRAARGSGRGEAPHRGSAGERRS